MENRNIIMDAKSIPNPGFQIPDSNKKVALIGRVNVGKSALFNRLIARPKAIVSKIPGTTRDRNRGLCAWQDKKFILIDTGGLAEKRLLQVPKGAASIEKEVRKQVIKAVEEADLILFILDINEEISPYEREISRIIKKSKKPSILVLNKADNPKKRILTEEFKWLKLGFGQPWPVSAANGSGTGDLLDEIVKKLGLFSPQKPDSKIQSSKTLKVSIIGRPNVGKSSLLNALLTEERAIISPVPYTTREPGDTLIYYRDRPLLLVDTAGIRKKAKIKPGIEREGVEKSLISLRKSDIALLVIDASQSIGHQDKSLINLVIKARKGLILVINKCDLLTRSSRVNLKYYQQMLPMARTSPIIFISAKTGKNVEKIFDLIGQVEKNRVRTIETLELTNFLNKTVIEKKFNPDIWDRIKITQTNTCPPEFSLRVSKNIIRKKLIHRAQLNIIEKEMRKKWHFEGTSVIINLTSHP